VVSSHAAALVAFGEEGAGRLVEVQTNWSPF
jgi:hypothetical protein